MRMLRGLSRQRWEHSLGVAEVAEGLCGRFGVPSWKGVFVGLTHDLAREMEEGELLRLAAGEPLTDLERRHPVLLHGRAAAALLRRAGVEDPEILEAVADHVVGRPGMGVLARILFVSDLLEPGRSFLEDGFRSAVLGLDLDGMVLRVLEKVFDHLRREGWPIAEPALRMYEELSP